MEGKGRFWSVYVYGGDQVQLRHRGRVFLGVRKVVGRPTKENLSLTYVDLGWVVVVGGC